MKPVWSIRKLLAMCLALVAVLSFFLFFAITFGLQATGLLPLGTASQEAPLRNRVMQEWHSWSDPGWQQSLSAEVAALGLDMRLYDTSNQTVFETTFTPPAIGQDVMRTVVTDSLTAHASRRRIEYLEVRSGDTLVGYIHLYSKWDYPYRAGDVAWSQVLLILWILLTAVTVSSAAAVWLLRKVFLTPLQALTEGAHLVHKGNLEFTLPQARVKEVAEVLDAFQRMSEGLRASILRQATMEEERRFILGSISHDLRTPLFALRGRLEGIRDALTSRPSQVHRYADAALRTLSGLDRLVADLFAYTRLNALEQTPALELLEAGTIIRQVVEGIQPLAEAKGVRLQRQGPDRLCPVLGDRHLLGRALSNLLENAIRHTPAGGFVTAGWKDDGETLSIWVEDTGAGIPSEILPHLFTPLYRGEVHRPRARGSTGLGLAIVHRVAEAHGGKVTATNRETGGARFILILRSRT